MVCCYLYCVGVLCLLIFVVHSAISSFVVILLRSSHVEEREGERVGCFNSLCSSCPRAVSVLGLFSSVQWIRL